jgi:hypothetical protein
MLSDRQAQRSRATRSHRSRDDPVRLPSSMHLLSAEPRGLSSSSTSCSIWAKRLPPCGCIVSLILSSPVASNTTLMLPARLARRDLPTSHRSAAPSAGSGQPRSLPLAARAQRRLRQRAAGGGPLSARSRRVPQHPGGIRCRLSTGLPSLVSRLRQRACSRRPLSAGRVRVSQDPGGIRRDNSASHTQIPRHAITSPPSALICDAECDVIQVPARHDISSRRPARPSPCRPGRAAFQQVRYSPAFTSACCI